MGGTAAGEKDLPRVLVTGFEPFPGAPVNPTQWLVERLRNEPPSLRGMAAFRAELLPVDYRAIGPRLSNPDGTLQRSVRGFPTVWRLATEYLYLRKLAPRSRALNAFYGAGFDHESEREVEWVMGACLLVRRAAFDEVGPFDERYFIFSEEVDWMRRAADLGWSVVFTPEARCVHVGGAAHGGRLFRENVGGHLRYLSLHGGPGEAERARRLLRAALVVRGRLYRGERGRLYREVAAWLGSGDAETLIA